MMKLVSRIWGIAAWMWRLSLEALSLMVEYARRALAMALDVVESWVKAAWSSNTELWIWCISPRSARPNRWATDHLVLLCSCLSVELCRCLI